MQSWSPLRQSRSFNIIIDGHSEEEGEQVAYQILPIDDAVAW
jgi:hypothetical protein